MRSNLIIFLFIITFLLNIYSASAQASCTPAPPGIVAWWKGEGNASDIVGNNHGTLVNNVSFMPGVVGDAFSFNGENYITVPNSPDLSFSFASPMTVETWIYRTGTNLVMHILGKRISCFFGGGIQYQLAFDSTGLHFGSYSGLVVTGVQPPLNTWMHLAATHSGNVYKFYINGNLAANATGFLGPLFTNPLTIATSGSCTASGPGSQAFNGLMDEISMYDRDLTNEEIQVIYNAGNLGKCTSLTINTPPPLAGLIGQFYSQQFTATLGTPPYSWSLVSGSLPIGMNFSSNGLLDGTSSNAGNFTFTVMVTDANNATAVKTFTMQVYATLPPPQIIVHKVGTTPVPGRIITYAILVENLADYPALNVEVVEFVEPWFNFSSSIPSPVNVTPIVIYPFNITVNATNVTFANITLNATIVWNIPFLSPGSMSIISYNVKLLPTIPQGLLVSGQACADNPNNPCYQNFKDCMKEGLPLCSIPCFVDPFIAGIPFLSPSACEACLDGVRNLCKYFYNQCNAAHGIYGEPCGEDQNTVQIPVDPNEKVVVPEGFIKSSQNLVYTIHFENIGNTSALDIFVTDKLDPDINFSTLQAIAPNGSMIPLLQNQPVTLFQQQKNQTIIIGNISINIPINETWTVLFSGDTINWSLINIDLPVNGTGELLYSVKPKSNLSSGTEIINNATIQFEIFTPITTNDTINIIDEVSPSCTMNPLPNTTTTLNFTISWSGIDPIGEIESYTIFASENDGPFNSIISLISDTSSLFQGEQGKTYRFICIATDTAGNVEVQSPAPEAVTTIPNPSFNIVGIPSAGNTVTINMNDIVNSNKNYILAISKDNTPGIQLSDGRIIPLNGDELFLVSLFFPNLIGLTNSQGILNASGQATALFTIPPYAPPGIAVYLGFVSINPILTLPQAVLGISPSIQLIIQ